LDNRIDTHIKPIRASHILIRGTERPVRIVLYKENNQYITHKELMTSGIPTEGSSCAFSHCSALTSHYAMYDGGYFPYKSVNRPVCQISEQEALHYAEADYKERVRKLASLFE